METARDHATVRWGRGALRAAALALALAVVDAHAPSARAADAVTDVDRRATLALWNSFSAPRKVWKLEEVTADGVAKLDLGPKPGQRQYAIRFGQKQADGSGRGFHKITIGMPSKDPAAEKDPWTHVTETKDPAAVVWKKVPGATSEAEKYADYAVRGEIGTIVLAVTQRRPLGEPDAKAIEDLLARYRALLDAAKKAGLFARVKMTLFVGESDQGTDLGSETPVFDVSHVGVRLRLRLEMVDVEDRPVEPKWYALELTGPLVKWATVEGAEAQPAEKRWIVRAPKPRTDLTIDVAPRTEEMAQALIAHRVSGAKDAPIGFSVKWGQK